MRRFMQGLGSLGPCLAIALAACGSDDDGGASKPSGCGAAPLACAPDQTCWTVNTSGHLACILAAPDGTEGKDCTNLINQATCAPGLFCMPNVSGSSSGTCQPFCQNAACANGGQCFQVGPPGGGEIVLVCSAPPGDAGTDADPSTDAGSDSSTGGAGGAGSDSSTGGASGSAGSGG